MLQPPNLNSPSNDESRNQIIAKLSLHKSFMIRQQIESANLLSREQAIDLCKDLFVHLAYKDHTFASILKSTLF